MIYFQSQDALTGDFFFILAGFNYTNRMSMRKQRASAGLSLRDESGSDDENADVESEVLKEVR